jgi:hypothetical protein
MLVEVSRPDGGKPMLAVANPIKLSAAPPNQGAVRWPMLGEHTYEVLARELRLPAAELDALASRGVITQCAARSEPNQKTKRARGSNRLHSHRGRGEAQRG